MKTCSKVLSLAVGLAMSSPSLVFAYCLDDVVVGMFTEREFTELDAPSRYRAQDKRLNALLRRGMKATGSNLISVEGASRKQALAAAAEQGLSVLAYLELEATSEKSPLPGSILDISSTTTLQIISVSDGKVLGEGSDLAETPGVDIEDALPEILTVKSVETLAGQAEKAACAKGLPSSSDPVVAKAKTAPPAANANVVDPALVANIQHALIAAGYDPGLPDGMMGRQTAEAIKLVEMELEMAPTGEPTSLLLQKLASLDLLLINDVQKMLHELGRLDGRPSGVLDGDTERAIKRAELDFRLSPPDGLPDQKLLQVLRSKLPEDAGETGVVDAAATPPADALAIAVLSISRKR